MKKADPNAFVIGGIVGGATTYTKEFMGLPIDDWRLPIGNRKSKIENLYGSPKEHTTQTMTNLLSRITIGLSRLTVKPKPPSGRSS